MSDESLLREWRIEYEMRRDEGQTVVPEQIVPAEHRRLLPEFVKLVDQRERLMDMVGSADGSMTDFSDETVIPGEKQGQPLNLAPISRYADLKKHAQGGLGEVFRGQDEALHREVAIKIIKTEHAKSRDAVQRFLVEAEVTSRLEHPGIVPVHGIARSDDGRPCYIMRFIHGDTLRTAIRKFHAERTNRPPGMFTSLAFRELLGRFVTVCNTIAYAHSRGIIHRDIKPENIMLGPYGETLVVDWGLAKAIERDKEVRTTTTEVSILPKAAGPHPREATLGGIGTLVYMSPEQAVGLASALRPTSDIYSLGATLYVLMTGKVAVSGTDQAEMIQKIHDGNIQAPREVNNQIPRALGAICMKAMAPRSKARYQTAQALAADIEHWLADERVSVHHDLPAAIGRWARRHKPLVSGVAALLLTGVIGFVVVMFLLLREQEQRNLAEAYLQMAREAVDELLTELGDKGLAHEPRMEKKRRQLLLRARDYYLKFLELDRNDPTLRRETALAHRRLADISRKLGEYEESATEYNRAIGLLAQLTTERPAEPEFPDQIADCYTYLGEVHRLTSKYQEAEDAYTQARVHLQKLLHDQPQSPETPRFKLHLARYHYNMGILYDDTRRLAEAAKEHERAIQLLKELIASHPQKPEHSQHLARVYLNIGPVLRRNGKPELAETYYREAIRIQKRLVELDAENSDYRYELGMTHNNLGYLLEKLGRFKDATDEFDKAQVLFARLAVEFRGIPEYAQWLAASCNNLGRVLARSGKSQEALVVWRQARDHLEKLVQTHEDIAEYKGALSLVLIHLGWLSLHDEKQLEEARKVLDLAEQRLKEALVPNAVNPTYREALRDLLAYRADLLQQLGDHAGVAEAAEKLASVFADRGADCYLAARFLARCQPTRPGDAEVHAERAVALLHDAQRRGLGVLMADPLIVMLERRDPFIREALARQLPSAEWINQDPAFDPLRQREDFQRFLAEIKQP